MDFQAELPVCAFSSWIHWSKDCAKSTSKSEFWNMKDSLEQLAFYL